MTQKATKLWQDYCHASGHSGPLPPIDKFGDYPELTDELLALVLSGTKQATCELAIYFENHNEPLPAPGDHFIITDGADTPKCIVRTTQVDIMPVRNIDDQFAIDEGEGDKTLKWWKQAHDAYFIRQATRDGFFYDDSMLCVAERFELVWPEVSGGVAG